MTGYSLPQYFYGGINFSRHVSIFSLFQIVKEQYLKHDSKVIFKIWPIVTGDNAFTHYRNGVPKGFEPLLQP